MREHKLKVVRRKPLVLHVPNDIIECPECNPERRLDPAYFVEIAEGKRKVPHKIVLVKGKG